MNAILDIIILCIVALTIFLAAKRGFIKTLLGSASSLVAIILALVLLSPVKSAFLNSSIAEGARESLTDTIAGFVSSDSENYDATLLENNNGFMQMVEMFGVDKAELQEKFNEWRHQNLTAFRDSLEEYICAPVIESLATALAFIVLFIGAKLILKLVTYLLDKFAKLPVLKQANTFLGIVLGVVMSVVYVYLFVWVVNLIIPLGSQLGWTFFKSIDVNETLLFGWFCENNIFGWIFG